MKNLQKFKSFEIPNDQLTNLVGGTEVCEAAYGCVLTATRDGNYFLIDTCIDVLCNNQTIA